MLTCPQLVSQILKTELFWTNLTTLTQNIWFCCQIQSEIFSPLLLSTWHSQSLPSWNISLHKATNYPSSCFSSFLTSHAFSLLLVTLPDLYNWRVSVLRMFLFFIFTHSWRVLLQSLALHTTHMPAISTWITKRYLKLYMS